MLVTHRGFGEGCRYSTWEGWSGVTIYRFVALPPNPIVGPVVTLEQVESEVRLTKPSLWGVKSVLLQEIVQSLHPQQKTKDVID